MEVASSRGGGLGQLPPPPLHCNCACIVSRGGGQGTVTLRFANLLRRSDIELLLCVCWLEKVVLSGHCRALQISYHSTVPCIMQSILVFCNFSHGCWPYWPEGSSEGDSDGTDVAGSGSGSGSSCDASQDATDSNVPSLTPDCVGKEAKSVCGVWGLANVLANGKLYFTRNVPQANCLPWGLESPAKPPAKPAPKATKSHAKP